MLFMLAAVIVSYRTSPHLRRCIAALSDDPAAPRIYVADNKSNPIELQHVLEEYPGVVAVPTDLDPGYAAGVNRGVGAAMADGMAHVLVLNDDVFVEPGAIDVLCAAAGDDGISAPCLASDGNGEFSGGRIDWATGAAFHESGVADFLTAACLMISRDAWERTGPFDERFFLYYEDVDWCVRAASRGVPLVLVPRVLGWHVGGATNGGGANPAVIFWWTRNRLWFVRKHRGYGAALAALAHSMRNSASGRADARTSSGGPAATREPRRVAIARTRARIRGLAAGLGPRR